MPSPSGVERRRRVRARLDRVGDPVAVRIGVEPIGRAVAVGVRVRGAEYRHAIVETVAVRVREAVERAVAVDVAAAGLGGVAQTVAVGVEVDRVR